LVLVKKRLHKAEPGVAAIRNQLRKRTYWQSQNAFEQDFFLESIAISESLICDSLESFLHKVDGSAYVMTLEKAANKVLRKCYKDTDVVLIQDIKRCSSERDYAIHEIAKVHSSNQMDWDERMLINEEIAREGLELVTKAKNFAKRKYSPPTAKTII
jgi:hypothetical protein